MVSFLHFCNDGFQACSLLLLPLLAGALGLDALEMGGLSSAQFLLGIIAAIPAGRGASRWGDNAVLVFAAGVQAAGFLAIAAFGHRWPCMLAYALAGIGYGMFHPVAFGLIARLTGVRDSARALGNFTAVGDLGRIALSGAALASLAVVSWKVATVGLGVIGLGAWGTALFALRKRKESLVPTEPAAPKNGHEPRCMSLADLGRHRPFAWASLLTVLDALSGASLLVFLPLLLASKTSNQHFVALAITAFLGANLVGKVFTGWLSEHLGDQAALLCCELGMAASILGLCVSASEPSVLLFAIALGLSSKGGVPVLLAMSAKRLPAQALEVGFGAQQTLVGMATVASPLLMGCIADRGGIHAAFAAAAGLCVVIALLVIYEPDATMACRRRPC